MREIITKEILRKALDEEKIDATAETVIYTENGPGGELDKWWMIMEDRKDTWQIRTCTDPNSQPKKSIIFSYPTLDMRNPTYTEHCFISALIENYDVYLWQGKGTNLANISPISNSAEFWRKRGDCIQATVDEVKEEFDIQGKSLTEYIVLDKEAYLRGLATISEDFKPDRSVEIYSPMTSLEQINTLPKLDVRILDFTHLGFNHSELVNSSENSKITEIVVNAGDFKSLDLDLFPKLEKLTIVSNNHRQYCDGYTSEIDDYLNEIKKTNITVEFKNFKKNSPEHPNQQCGLSLRPNQKKIIFEMTENIESITFSRSNKLEEFEMNAPNMPKRIGFVAESQLRSIKLNPDKYFNQGDEPISLVLFDISYLQEIYAMNTTIIPNGETLFNYLEKLTTSITSFNQLNESQDISSLTYLKLEAQNETVDIQKLTSLKILELNLCNNSMLDLSQQTELEELKITNCSQLTSLNLTNCHKLKKLTILGAELLETLDLSQLPNLSELLIISSPRIEKLDITNCPKLQKITMNQCPSLACIQHGPLSELEKLHINTGSDLTPAINISSANKLSDIKLAGSSLTTGASMFINNVTFNMAYNVDIQCNILEIEDCYILEENLPRALQTAESIKLTNCCYLESFAFCKELKFLSISKSKASINYKQFENCPKITHLSITDSSLSLENGFLSVPKNVRSLDLIRPKVSSLHIKDLTQLEEFYLSLGGQSANQLTSLSFTNCPQIKRLSLAYPKSIKSLDLSTLVNLEELTISNAASLEKLDLSKLYNLKRLTIKNCHNLSTLNLPPHVEVLKLADLSSLGALNLGNSKTIVSLQIASPNVTLYNLASCTMLENIDSNAMCRYDFSNNRHLKSIRIDTDNPIYVNSSNLPQLRQLQVASPSLSELDLTNTHLNHTEIIGSPNINLIGLTPENTSKRFYLNSPLKAQDATNYDAVDQRPPEIATLIAETVRNKASSVACFSKTKSSRRKIDGKTTGTQIRIAPEDIKAQVISGYKSIPEYYRWNVYNHVDWEDGPVLESKPSPQSKEKRQTWPTFSASNIESWQKYIEANPNDALGILTGNFIPGERYALTSEFPQSEFKIKVLCKDSQGNPVEASLIWDPDHRLHYIQFPNVIPNSPVEILYLAKQTPKYDRKDQKAVLMEKDPKTLLPPEMLVFLRDIIDNDSDLKKIFSKATLSERLDALIQFCEKDIVEGELLQPTSATLETLKSIIKEKKGVCRHKSELFMYLARYMGVPVNMIGSEKHAFVEIPTLSSKQEPLWYRADLGGALNDWDKTPAHIRQSKLQDLSKKTRPVNISEADIIGNFKDIPYVPVSQQSIFTPPQDLILKKYKNAFQQVANESNLTRLDKLFNEKHLFPPLLKLEKDQNPFQIHATLVEQIKNSPYKDQDVIFINNAHEFAYYLSPPFLEKGERKKIDGPLHRLMENGGVVIVNWTNFSATEIASYKSILDTKPTLLGREPNTKPLVIGLQNNDAESCAAFNSRCQSFTIDKSVKLNTPSFAESTEENIIKVNLFKSISWRKHLLGDIEFKGNELNLLAGPLRNAIELNKPLMIENPPVNDKDFDLLMHRLLVEKRIFYNGDYTPIPAEFTIKTVITNNANTWDKVSVIDKTIPNDARDHIYVGLYNFHELIKQLKIKNTLAEDSEGYLREFDIKKQVFYITQNIPESDWQYLIDTIINDKELSKKNFEFKLAPQVSIQNVASNKEDPIEEKCNIYISNDPDYRAIKLQEELSVEGTPKPLIIDISLNSTFSDLLAKIERKPHPELAGKVMFEYTKSALLKELQNGRTVILNGPMSGNLYQQLLPLLNEPSHLQLNSKRKQIHGKLVSVQPHSQKAILKNYQVKDYFLTEYYKDFSDTDRDLIQKIDIFISMARLLPHRGTGRPQKPSLNHATIDQMLKRLKAVEKRKLHPNNPIKGLFHYDYPKDSEDFAYLNVIAKFMFGDKMSNKNQEKKLKSMLDMYQIDSEAKMQKYAWQILNCFGPYELKQILGNYMDFVLVGHSEYPQLTPNASYYLWQNIEPYLTYTPPETEKRLHVDKRDEQFKILLEDPQTPLLIIKGEAGAGKTYASEKLKNRADVDYYEGTSDGILNWLRNPGDKLTILALDEANMAKPGTWDFLKGLLRDPSEEKKDIYYKGEKYTITKNHKVIATGNPESYAERYHHETLQRYGETLYFKRPDDVYVANNILNNILNPVKLNDTTHIYAILDAFKAVKELNSSYYYSNRDIINSAERFITLYKKFNEQLPSLEILYYACLTEFAGTLTKPEERKQFEADLNKIFNFTSKQTEQIKESFTELLLPKPNEYNLIELMKDCAVPKEASYILEGMQQALLTRARLKDDKDIPYHKRGFLLEGEPGLGKSTLIEALLEQNGFSKKSKDPKMKYYLISASNESEVYDILEKAHREGSVVILDEINLDKNAESRINELLDKPSPDGREFMLFSSQNASSADGRAGTSPALRNRLHVVHMPAFSRETLNDIGQYWRVPEPEKFVDAYIASHRENENINMRTFYNLAQEFGERISAELNLSPTV